MNQKVLGFYTIENGGVKLLEYRGNISAVVLPKMIDGKLLTKIGAGAFAYPSKEESLADWTYVLEKDHMSDMLWEKEGNGNLVEKLHLPDTLCEIETGAFAGCTKLKQITLPNRLKYLPDYVFSGCKMLSAITIPQTVQTIGAYAFHDCRELKEVVIPSGVRSIGNYAFYNARGLQRLHIPGDIEFLGLGAFKNCELLKQIEIEGHINIQSIVADISHEFFLEVTYPQKAHLFFPDEACEYIEDYPARQFHQVNYGSGHLYRQCISNSGIDYRRYDQLFPIAVREETQWTAISIAMNRLSYPHELMEERKQAYLEYMKENAVEAAEMYLSANDMKAIEHMADLDIFTEQNLDRIMEYASRQRKVEFLSFFMDYRHKYGGVEEKSFDL